MDELNPLERLSPIAQLLSPAAEAPAEARDDADLGDRRRDTRRPSRGMVWRLDEGCERVVELGRLVNLSRGGVAVDLGRDQGGAVRPGDEWLVILDDPTGRDPLATDRPALLQIKWVNTENTGRIRAGASFIARPVGRCGRRLPRRLADEPDQISDLLAGDVLDELADRLLSELQLGEA